MQLQEKLNFKRIEVSKSAVFNYLLGGLVALLKFALTKITCSVFTALGLMKSITI